LQNSKRSFGLVVCVTINFLLLSACTTVQQMPAQSDGAQFVNACNIQGHVRCMYLTAIESTEDGWRNKWARHWFSMSYIGKACEKEYGRTVAVLIESLFAIPHYFLLALGNGFSSIVSPLIPDEKKHAAEAKLIAQHNSL